MLYRDLFKLFLAVEGRGTPLSVLAQWGVLWAWHWRVFPQCWVYSAQGMKNSRLMFSWVFQLYAYFLNVQVTVSPNIGFTANWTFKKWVYNWKPLLYTWLLMFLGTSGSGNRTVESAQFPSFWSIFMRGCSQEAGSFLIWSFRRGLRNVMPHSLNCIICNAHVTV